MIFNIRAQKSVNNESGMILLIASTFIVIICIVVIGLINRNVSQAMSATRHYKQLQAEQLARGAWWLVYDDLSSGRGFTASSTTITRDFTSYTITTSDGGMVGGHHQYRVRVTY